MVQHTLVSQHFRQGHVLIPETWPVDYGFILRIGDPSSVSPLVRIQSRCAYGEIFGSLHCDCGPQLAASFSRLNEEGGGYIIYLEQEGRGAGVLTKARAYEAYEQTGMDTFSFYEHIGLPDDSRDYTPVVEALCELGISSIRLLTNNQRKVMPLRSKIAVTPLPLICTINDSARDYLVSKRNRGHTI